MCDQPGVPEFCMTYKELRDTFEEETDREDFKEKLNKIWFLVDDKDCVILPGTSTFNVFPLEFLELNLEMIVFQHHKYHPQCDSKEFRSNLIKKWISACARNIASLSALEE